MDNKIYFHLPGLFEHFYIYKELLPIYKNEKEKFLDNMEIYSLYGAPLNTAWNGGRILKDTPSPTINQVINLLEQYDISAAFTMTNCLLEEKDLNNYFCNMLMQAFHNEKNAIIINSPLLEEYIRKTYPKYKMFSSTTKCLTDKEKALNDIENSNYDLVIPDYNFNNNFEFLSLIKNKEKCKFLVNPVCMDQCPNRMEHYIFLSKVGLNKKIPEEESFAACPFENQAFWQAQKRKSFISIDSILNQYVPMGFSHFKIEGRTAEIIDLIEILVYYLVKPEYQLEIRERLFSQILSIRIKKKQGN